MEASSGDDSSKSSTKSSTTELLKKADELAKTLDPSNQNVILFYYRPDSSYTEWALNLKTTNLIENESFSEKIFPITLKQFVPDSKTGISYLIFTDELFERVPKLLEYVKQNVDFSASIQSYKGNKDPDCNFRLPLSTGQKHFLIISKKTTIYDIEPKCNQIIYKLNINDEPSQTYIQDIEPNTVSRLKKAAALNFDFSGYGFLGWSINYDSSRITYSDGASITPGKGITLYAVYSEKSYSITYQNTYDVNNPNPTSFSETENVVLQKLERPGYSFSGWECNGSSVSGWTSGEKKSDLILTAKWKPLTYRITYSLNGGENASGNPAYYTIEERVILQEPIRKGFRFEGWLCAGNMVTGWKPGEMTGSVVLEAKWSNSGYLITYNLNGGTNHPDNPENFLVEDNVSLRTPSRDGYTFEGWTCDGTIIDGWTSGEKTENVEVTANWSAISYSISYNLNGGANSSNNPNSFTVEDTVDLHNPTRTGFVFAGWTCNGSSVSGWKAGEKAEEVLLIANWATEGYSIAYNLNGGINNSENPSFFTKDDKVVLKAPSRSGFEFTGWTLDGSSISGWNAGEKKSNVELVANWSIETYLISYNLNGGKNNSNNPDFYTVEDNVVLKNPVRSGYEFTGWTCDGKLISGWLPDTKTLKVVLDANWRIAEYQITYNMNGGVNNSKNPESFTVDDSVVLKNPTRFGYDFAGWTNDDEPITGWNKGEKAESIEITANWTAIKYPINYVLNGGTNDSENPKTYTLEDTVVLKVPEKSGYTFDGWLLDESVTSGWEKGEKNGEVTLEATWSENKVSLSIEMATISSDVNINLYKSGTVLSANTGFATYTWFIDGKKLTGQSSNVLDISLLSIDTGYHIVTLSVTNSQDDLFSATYSITITGTKE